MRFGSIKKFFEHIIDNKSSIKFYDIKSNLKYFSKLKNPQNEIERGFYQYKCQMKEQGFLIKCILNMISMILLPIYKRKLYNVKLSDVKLNDKEALFFSNGLSDYFIPIEVKKEFKHIINIKEYSYGKIDNTGQLLFNEIRTKYPLSFYFALKCLLKISAYCEGIRKYNVSSIIASCEYSFTSSVLTRYCEMQGIEHINVMHGEKLYIIRDAFCAFHRCSVWDDYYIDLFKSLNYKCNKFICYYPDQFINFRFELLNKSNMDTITYYLQDEKKHDLNKIKNILQHFTLQGYHVKIRPHPNYSSIDVVNNVFNKTTIEIESFNEFSIKDSFFRTDFVVSKFSTVLFQAYKIGKKTVIDDISNPIIYSRLHDLNYIMVNKADYKLSELFNRREVQDNFE